jgi:hypothetical protein
MFRFSNSYATGFPTLGNLCAKSEIIAIVEIGKYHVVSYIPEDILKYYTPEILSTMPEEIRQEKLDELKNIKNIQEECYDDDTQGGKYSHIAVELQIVNIIKGNINKNILLCYEPCHLVSREDTVRGDLVLERYPVGKTVLAFLEKYNDPYYKPCDTQNSIKLLSDPELKIYIQKIREFLPIWELQNKDERNLQMVEWLVQCLETPCLQKDAGEDLYYGRYKRNYSQFYTYDRHLTLTKSQHSRIANVLVNSPDFIKGVCPLPVAENFMIDLLGKYRNKKIAFALLEYLKKLKFQKEFPALDIESTMLTMSRLLDSLEGIKLLEALKATQDVEIQKSILKKFIEVIEIEINKN